ncbi:hypothetical protein [Serratia marcescens]|uniref:hypothetical protein n=1 Tax=Serratia marcescens TaxID=615 RepID=UPI0037CD5BD4
MTKSKFMEMKVSFFVTDSGQIKQEIDVSYAQGTNTKEFQDAYMAGFPESQRKLVDAVIRKLGGKKIKRIH